MTDAVLIFKPTVSRLMATSLRLRMCKEQIHHFRSYFVFFGLKFIDVSVPSPIKMLLSRLSMLLVVLCHLMLSTSVVSFVPSLNWGNRYGRLTTWSSVDDELEDLDRARAAFEDILAKQGKETIQPSQQHSSPFFPLSTEQYAPPPLTASSRQRRLTEMELLESLEDSDEAIDELVTFWMVERDAESAMRLQDMERICSPGMVEEERGLRKIIKDYGPDWVEPISRLAALLYVKGEIQESEYWCRVALAVKPWHFEVFQTLTFNALRLKDFVGALQVRRKGLPPLNEAKNHKKRKEWVKRALSLARESFVKAEDAAEKLQKDVFLDDIPAGGETWQ